MKNNNKFLAALVNYLNKNYTHDTKRHFRILADDEIERYSDLLNDSDSYWYQPYATDGKNVVSLYDAYGSSSNFLFTYINKIVEAR